jgi:predicted ATPase
VFLTGEPGIGKTTVVDHWLTRVRTTGHVRVGRGQCLEQYGEGEAYLPILEALGELWHAPGGPQVLEVLQRYAPTWVLQMPALVQAADLAVLQRTGASATRERMLREMAEALAVLTAVRPLVLVLEDLQWSDRATLDLLAYVAQRRERARLLLLGTYRPAELVARAPALQGLTQGLQAQGQGQELRLQLLTEDDVRAYVAQRCGARRVPEDVARRMHQRTDGNALFMVNLVDYYLQHGWGTPEPEADGRPASEVDSEVPESLQQLIVQQFVRLREEAQRVLEMASVAGMEFPVAAVSAALHQEPEEVEAVCEALAREGHWLHESGVVEWPDGTVSGRYGFRHALYQQVVYQRIAAARRVRGHRLLGERLAGAYGAQAGEVAAVLAEHYGRGRVPARAVSYLQQAAENAAHRYAPHTVVALLTRALTLLRERPETPERPRQELDIHVLLGPALMAAKGYAAPEVEQTYARARVLCQQVGERPQRFPVLRGLCQFYRNSGAFPTARALGEQLVRLAQRDAAPTLSLEAYEELGATLYHLGEFATAWTHLEQGIALTDPMGQCPQVLHEDVVPGVRCLVYAALTLWCLGYPTQALRYGLEALARARELAHPPSLVLVQHFIAFLYYYRRDVPALQAQAEALLTVATAQGFPLWAGFGTCWGAWSLTMQGQGEAGLAQMHQGIAAVLATGQRGSWSVHLLLLAETAAHAGQVEEGLRCLAEALTAFETTGRGNLLAEGYRLQGSLLLRQTVPDAAQAEACFRRALTIARRQQARSWELRAATSLCRLWQQQHKRSAAYALLAPLYGWFSEGFDTADLQEARVLLEEIGG